MDNNDREQLTAWIDQRLSVLDPEACWQPNISAALLRLKSTRLTGSWFTPGWGWAIAAAAAICLFLVVRPSPAGIVHKCLECSVAVWQSISSSASSQASVQPQNTRTGAPDFHLLDQNKNVIALSGLKGKVVLLNFWATWCHGCQTEVSWFIEFQNIYRNRGLVVVGISMDEDGWKSVGPWLKQKNPNYPIVIGNEALGKQFGLDSMPRTILIDRAGKIAVAHSGLVNKTETDASLRTLLDEK